MISKRTTFPAWALPRTPLGDLTCSPRSYSRMARVGRGIPHIPFHIDAVDFGVFASSKSVPNFYHRLMVTLVVPYFSSGCIKSGIQPFFGNPSKSSSGQISSWIWQIPAQLQYVQLIMDKTNTADLSSGVFAIFISVSRMKNTKFIAISQILSKSGNKQ